MNFNQSDIQAIGETLFGIITDDNDYTVMELDSICKNDNNWIELDVAFYRNSTPENYITTTIFFTPCCNYAFFGIKVSDNKMRNFRLYYNSHIVREF